jgi:hypothetical protein
MLQFVRKGEPPLPLPPSSPPPCGVLIIAAVHWLHVRAPPCRRRILRVCSGHPSAIENSSASLESQFSTTRQVLTSGVTAAGAGASLAGPATSKSVTSCLHQGPAARNRDREWFCITHHLIILRQAGSILFVCLILIGCLAYSNQRATVGMNKCAARGGDSESRLNSIYL